MFGREVTIDGRRIFVTCTPRTPLSEVLRRAAAQLDQEERAARKNDPMNQAYQKAIDDLWKSA
jgi:hypothetical protein